MTETDTLWMLREVKTGIVTFILLALTLSLGRYVYLNRVTLTVEAKDARDAAVGLAVVFGSLCFRSAHLWMIEIAQGRGWEMPFVDSPILYLAVLAVFMAGTVLVLRAFQPWPIWAGILATATVIPLGMVAFL